MEKFYLIFSLVVFFGPFDARGWTVYNGETLQKQVTQLTWDAASVACRANHTVVASPLNPAVSTAVEELVLATNSLTSPDLFYWTGLKRNVEGAGDWINEHVRATKDSIDWRPGFSDSSPGDCLAMEVMPFGVNYYPEDCNVVLNVICHKFEASYPTKGRKKTLVEPPVPHAQYTVDHPDDCLRACAIDLECIGYYHDSGSCTLYNEYSFVGGPPTTVAETTVPTTTEQTTTVAQTTTAHATTAQTTLGSTLGSTSWFNSTFDGFNGTTFSVNGTTDGHIDTTTTFGTTIGTTTSRTTIGTTTVGTTMVTTDIETTTTVTVIPVEYRYKKIMGCIDPYDPLNGYLDGGNSTRFDETRLVECSWKYDSIPGPNETMVCGTDRRWTYNPACIINATNCPLGWYRYQGSCYQIRLGPVSWFDQSCDTDNAFRLYIDSYNEANFIDKLLYYHQDVEFWTGGTNLYMVDTNRLYWHHRYEDIEFTRYESFSNTSVHPESSCLFLKQHSNATFYYEVGDCFLQKAYVCRKGRLLLGGGDCPWDSWCIGRGVCGWGAKCKCPWSGYSTLYGSDNNDDPYAYCGNKKVVVGDSVFIRTKASDWNMTKAECDSEGGSLLTVLSEYWEDVIFQEFGASGQLRRFWSGYRFEGTGSIVNYGITHYAITDLAQIPWRNVIDPNWINQYRDVLLRTSTLGVRYDVVTWAETKLQGICHLIDYTIYYQNNKKFVTAPLVEHYPILTDTQCYMKCHTNEQCLSFNYFPGTYTCKLFGTASPSATLDSPNTHMYKSGCRLPNDPVNGYLIGPIPDPAPIGTTVNYACDVDYKVPDGYDSFLTCTDSGSWSNVPKCVYSEFQCPQGWEQDKLSCYNVQETRRSYDTAVLTCTSMQSSLIEIYSSEEMQYLTKVLDHAPSTGYFTGANCKIMQGFYSWSSNSVNMITYTKWATGYNEPTFSGDCVVLKRTFWSNDKANDTGEFWYSSADCGQGYDLYRPFVCKRNLLNVGAVNCSRFGADPCKQNSECLNEKCVCRPSFYQLGDDDIDTTQCLPIQPVKSGPCYGMVEFCLNNATCDTPTDTCLCPPGYFQNGVDHSISTVCQEEEVICADGWLQHNGHCFKLRDTYQPESLNVINGDSDPAIHCGLDKAYLAVIPDAETNEVVRTLGVGLSYRIIGLVDEFKNDEYEWLATGEPLTFTQFEFTNRSRIIGASMNPIGYWVKITYDNTFTDVNRIVPKNIMACEKPNFCPSVPVIANALPEPTALFGEEVGTEYIYTCNPGYIRSGTGNAFIKCREIDRRSLWDPIPSCVSLLSEKYVQIAYDLQGTLLEDLTNIASNQICASHCYDNKDCEAFYFLSGNCQLYDKQSTQNTIPSGGEIWNTNLCDDIPHVPHAAFTSTGRNFGDTVTYRCEANYRIAYNSSAVLTCKTTGRWSHPPPICISRFIRQPGAIYRIGSHYKQKMYVHVITPDDCEVKCLEEPRFRCMFSVWRKTTCHLWKWLPLSYRDQSFHDLWIDDAVSSSLMDADIDLFEKKADTRVLATGNQYTNVSYEMCAQECGYDITNCTMFDYNTLIQLCTIYNDNPTAVTYETNIEYRLYTKRNVCAPPPVVTGISFEQIVKQSPTVDYIGDVLQAHCDVFGEELVAGHSGRIECVASGKWTPRHPSCKNLCEPGWYMFNYTCYQLIETPKTFWDAFSHCHSVEAGLINVYTQTEFNYIRDIWNYTSSTASDIWIGLYTDKTWQWTERLGGDLNIASPTFADLAMVLSLSSLNMTSVGVNSLYPFACEKAAPKLSCPAGWSKFKEKCYQVQATEGDYATAKSTCYGMGATLASVNDFQERDVLAQLANITGGKDTYVGLEMPAGDHYKWDDGSIPRFTFLNTYEGLYTTDRCGIILMDDTYNVAITFDTLACTAIRPFICQAFIDQVGISDDFSNLPCSTDSFCSNPDLACLGGVNGSSVLPPRCSGKECPPPWVYMNNKCVLVKTDTRRDFMEAAHYCWNLNGNLVTFESFIEIYDVMEILPEWGENFFIGYFAYMERNLIDIRTNTKATFPVYDLYQRDAMTLHMQNKGRYLGSVSWAELFFICERSPTNLPPSPIRYEGCFNETDILLDRDLPFDVFTDGAAMTVELCTNHCQSKGYLYAGIMNGQTCGCGNSRGNLGMEHEGQDCLVPCTGNPLQKCGGLAASTVYRASARACVDSMPKNPLDPRICYTGDSHLKVFGDARYNCLHQNGEAVLPKTPVHEKYLYNQVFLGLISQEQKLDVNFTNYVIWTGLTGPSYSWIDDDRVATEYLMWDNKKYASAWKWSGLADLSNEGAWKADFAVGGTVKARTACDIYDYQAPITGSHLRVQYRESYHPVLISKYGEMNVSSRFDFYCLTFMERCPDGFSLMFWYYVNNTLEDKAVFSMGDCCFKEVIASTGLCIFYTAANQTLTVVYATKDEVRQMAFVTDTKHWAHLLIHFDRNETISLFVNGIYSGDLLSVYGLKDIKNIQQESLNFHLNDENIVKKNFTFVPAAPDSSLLQEVREHPYLEKSKEEMQWTSFQPWSVEDSEWNSPGVDGNGFILPSKSSVYEFDEVTLNFPCITSNQCWTNGKTFALWVKLSTWQTETVDIFSYGAQYPDGIYLVYDGGIKMMKIAAFDFTAQFNVTLGVWTHVALVLSTNTGPVLYIDGVVGPAMTKTGAPPVYPNTNITRHLGSVMCPPGWTMFGSSCYKYINDFLMFWELQHQCESYGGNLASVDDDATLNFIRGFLYNTITPVYLGVYNFGQQDYGYLFVNTEGRRQNYIFWDTSPLVYTTKNSFSYLTCDPVCGNLAELNLFTEHPDNFTGYGGLCEIDHNHLAFRREDKMRCQEGWHFWEGNCYFVSATLYTGDTGVTQCSSFRGVLVEIDSLDEQRFLSNYLYAYSALPKTFYIGAKFRTILDNGVGEFTYGDFQPLTYDNWAVPPSNAYNPTGCSVINCSTKKCSWRDVPCTESWPLICEKPARKYCAHNWEEFVDSCISIQDTSLTPQSCTTVGAQLIQFRDAAEVQEFAASFDLAGGNCKTDGVFTASGYVWGSTGELTYFYDQTLTGIGNCVGITATGLQRVDCTLHICAVCQHGQGGDVSIDNVYFLDDSLAAGDIVNIYSKEKYIPETYEFDMATYNSTTLTLQGVKSTDINPIYLEAAENITFHEDLVLGPVPVITNLSTGLIYNVQNNDSCLQSLEHCRHSFGISFLLFVSNVTSCMLVDTVTDGTTGMSVAITNENDTVLAVTVHELNYFTEINVPVVLEKEWTHINVVWQKYVGLKVFINFNLIEKVSPIDRLPVFPVTTVITNSSLVIIANCSLDMESYLHIKDVKIGTSLMEDWEIKNYDDIPRFIDFDDPPEKSRTNIHTIIDESMVTTYWRNSLFLTAVKIVNPTGLVPAIEVPDQMMMCFSNNDACQHPYTLSFWLFPRDIQQSQIFIYSRTKSHSVGIIDSTKVWYDTTVDKYYFTIEFDRTRITYEFYIYLFEWSHLVLSADFRAREFHMYLNSAEVLTKTVTFVASRVRPVYKRSFFTIGDMGTFDIDDLQFLPYISKPSKMYVLKSCTEYMLAGITGLKNETIDPDTLDGIHNDTIELCNLDLNYKGFYFSMEMNEINPVTNTVGLNATINYLPDGNVTSFPGIHFNGVYLNQSGFNITGVELVKCFYDVKYCFFGFTFSAWIQINDVSEMDNKLTLFEMGGDINLNENGIRVTCDNITDVTKVNCSAILINGTDQWSLHFTLMKKQLLHFSLTWNPHLTLIVALNGHSTADFGREQVHTIIPEASSPSLERPISVGYSVFAPGSYGELVVDELTIVDNFLEDKEIKKLFGTKLECPEFWNYIPITNKCYAFTTTKYTHAQGVTQCQLMGATLATIPNYAIRMELSNILAALAVPNAWVDLKQLPRGNILFPLRQPNAKEPEDFPDLAALSFVSTDTMPRCVDIHSAGTWLDCTCTSVKNIICEMEPMYVKESPFYIDASNINDEHFSIEGDITSHRGVTNQSLMFNSSYIEFLHADDCMSNFDYCHNGLRIRFWLMTFGPVAPSEMQVLYSNMYSNTSHGVTIYITHDATQYLLGVNIRNRVSYTTSTVQVSSNVWTNVILKISHDSQINIYLNGELATPVTLNVNTTDVMIRQFGVATNITFGAGQNGADSAFFMMDDLLFLESSNLMLLPLKYEVYTNFPEFNLPFDDVIKRVPLMSGSTSTVADGYIGNALYSNASNPTAVDFIGQFAYDCFGAGDTCFDGFTMFIWIRTPSSAYTNGYSIFSNINQNTGISIDYRPLDFSLNNRFWILVRDGTTTEQHYPFDLYPDTWSHVGITWYINGTMFFELNGVPMMEKYTRTMTPSVNPVTNIQVDTTVYTGLPTGMKGGVDELFVIRRPITEVELFDYYENSTFLHDQFYFSFDDLEDSSNESLTIDGFRNQSLRILAGNDTVNLTSFLGTDVCFSNMDRCVHGFTLRFAFRFVLDLDIDQVVMTTGGDNPDGVGFALTYTAMNVTLPFRRYFQVDVRMMRHEYVTWFNVQYNVWSDILITFHPRFGIRVFVDDVLAPCDNAVFQPRLTPPAVFEQDFIIGQDNGDVSILGIFDIDEIHIMDVAIFEDDLIGNEAKIIKHEVHTTPVADLLDQYTEVTRGECQELCNDNGCDSYTYCDHEYFGTCNLYTNMTNITQVDVKCDVFSAVSLDPFPLQQAGCLVNLSAAVEFVLPSGADCAFHCKSLSYAYSYIRNGPCFCLNHRNDDVDIFDAQNLTFTQSCPGITIDQSTGWRDFIRPGPITVLNVLSQGGAFVLMNESIIVDFEVNEDSYAGFKIDAGDGRSIYHTKYNWTEFIFEQEGVYTVTVTAMNEISSMTQTIDITVFEAIEGLLISHVDVIATDSEEVFNLTVIKGTSITCDVDYGDGTNDTMFKANSSLPFIFTHAYAKEQHAVINATCYNFMTSAWNDSTVIVIDPMVNLTMETPYSVIFGENITLNFTLVQGSNISMNFDLNGEEYDYQFYHQTNLTFAEDIEQLIYNRTGEHEVNVSAINPVSGPFNLSSIVLVDVVIVNASLNFTLHARVGVNVDFDLSIEEGSNMDVHIDYGDGSANETYFLDDDYGIFNLIHSINHTYTSPGTYVISIYLYNSVSDYLFTEIIHVEVPVDLVDFVATGVSDPFDLANLTFVVNDLLQIPTNALVNISFGNGDLLEEAPLIFTENIMTILYNFTLNGVYVVEVTMWNNVSFINFTEVLTIGQPITNLTASSSSLFVAVGEQLNLNIDVETGSQVNYIVDFGNDSFVYSTSDYTAPNANFTISKLFMSAGVYNITITANNTFNMENINVTVIVQEKLEGMAITNRKVGKMNYPFYFYIEANSLGTNSCFVFTCENMTEFVVGGYICKDKPDFAGKNFSYFEGNPIVFSIEFIIPGPYNLVVNGSNEVSWEIYTTRFIILEFPCYYPEVFIYGLSKNVVDPTKFYASDSIIIRAISDTYCDPLQTVLFMWQITALDPGMPPVSLETSTLPYLIMKSNALDYGTYQINVTVLITNYLEFNDTATVYIQTVQSPLVPLIKGDEIKSIRSASPLTLDASWSFDPDFPLTGIPFNLTWFCWTNGNDPTKFNISTAVLEQVGKSCFNSTTDPVNINGTVVTIPSSQVTLTQYYFVAVMTSGSRLETRAQEVNVLTPDIPELILECVENCIGPVSSTKPVRFKGLCLTCTVNNRLSIPYTWRLFHIVGGTKTEIVDFATWTDTGTVGANLMIKPYNLVQGGDYEIRLASGAAFTSKFFHVVFSPYNGACYSDLQVGKAFASKYTFSCNNWLDESTRSQQDPAVDSLFLYPYTFTFSYQVVDTVLKSKTPVFEVRASEGITPGVVLPPGKEEFGYMVKIIVDIVDMQGSKTNFTLDVQVKPFLEDSGSDVMDGFEMNVCQRERDMGCILTFCDGLVNLNSSHPDDVQLLDDVVNTMFDNQNIIQDNLHVSQATSVLSTLSESTEDLSIDSQDKMRGMFTDMVGAAEGSLSTFLTLEEKENMALELLAAVTRFCQKTKYDQECTQNCDMRLTQGENAVAMIDLVHNLTGLLLLGNVPGEGSKVLELEQGNVKFQATRTEPFSLVNRSMEFDGVQTIRTRSLPEEITSMPFVDLEIMTSDNLYTTDASSIGIKTQVTTFELLTFGGERMMIDNLPAEIDITTYPPISNDLNFTYVNLTDMTDSDLFFIELRINETNVVPVLVLRPDDLNANITYYVQKGSIPSSRSYAITGNILDNAEFEDSTSSYIIKMDVSDLWTPTSKLPTNVYIGLEANYNTTELSPMVNVSLYVLGCFYWSPPEKGWSQYGLKLGPVQNITSTVCETSHLSSFGMNMFVPPNTIDFSTVFSKFSTDNLAVLITVGLVLLAYFFLLIPIIRADRRDFKKWAIYPLADNVMSDVYHYQVSVYTGIGKNSGTTSKVYFVLGGEEGDTEVRLLQDDQKRPMLRGSVNNYLLSVPSSLGNLLFMRIWLDNQNVDPWLLNMILIRDVQTGERYAFLCDKWFAFDKGVGQIDHLFPVATPDEMSSFGHLFFSKSKKDLTDGHLWFSVVSRPMHSTFTRAQRLSCCLSLLFLTMITNAMWYKSDTNNSNEDISQNVHLGPFTFSSQEFFTSLFGSLIVVPVNLLIVTLFRKSRPKTQVSSIKIQPKARENSQDVFNRELDCATPSHINPMFSTAADQEAESWASRRDPELVEKKADGKSKYPLPHWCIYIAWMLVALSVAAAGFFTVLYSMEWGSNKSSKWLTSFMLSFVESVLLVQPLKVITLAIVIALVFKTIDADDSVEEVFVIGEPPQISEYPEHRQRFVNDFMETNKMIEAKEHRLKMNRLFETIRTILIYVVYVSVVAVLAYENRDVNAYPTYKNLHNVFIQPQTKYQKSFSNLQSTRDFYTWMEETVLPGLYLNGWYNDSITDLEPYTSDNTWLRLGPPRIRQARIDNLGCETPIQIREYISVCYPSYKTNTYENRNFNESWDHVVKNETDDVWSYKDTLELDGLPTVGRYASYSGGGYLAQLGTTIDTASQILQYLRNTSWIDKKTRAVFVEFNLFNGNVNLFCSVILLLEFPPTGSVFPYWEVNPVVMYRYVGPSAVFLFVFDVIFATYTLYYLIDMIKEMRKKGFRGYFAGVWNIVDFINIILSVIVCAFYGVHFIITKLTLNKFKENRDEFINLQRIVLWDQLFGIILGFILFLSMLKTLRLVRFNAKIAQLYGTITKSAKPLLNYMVVFLISFTAFVSCGYLLFGPHDLEYSNFLRTTETLMSMLMMKVNIDTVLVANGPLGALFIFSFVLFVVFVLLNILLSIINEAFSDSRKDPSCQSDDPQMVDFLLGQLKRMIWGRDRNNETKVPEDVFYRMDKLERKMDRYFVKVIADERANNY